MYKFILFVGILVGIYYYLNQYTGGWLTTTIMNLPQMIAFAVAIIVLMFPRDYDKIPDMIYKSNKTSRKKI